MRAVTTWILVADGQRARVLVNQGVGKGVAELGEETRTQPVPPNREIHTDRPGRSFESASPERHAMVPRSDPHREEKADFARELAERLAEAERGGRFDRLVIAAAPQTLGDLRRQLEPQVASRIVAELPKDLTKATVDAIGRQLESVIAV